jgi:hypothetical protein
MNYYIYVAAWALMVLAAILAIAAKGDWATLAGSLTTVGLMCVAAATGLMHPPDTLMAPVLPSAPQRPSS